MKYKYRCTSRFPVLLMIEGTLSTIRPNQVIEVEEELNYSLLKPIVEKKEAPKRQYKPRAKKTTKSTGVTDGNNTQT